MAKNNAEGLRYLVSRVNYENLVSLSGGWGLAVAVLAQPGEEMDLGDVNWKVGSESVGIEVSGDETALTSFVGWMNDLR